MLVFNKGSSFVGFADTLQDRDELMWAIVLVRCLQTTPE